MVRAHDDVHSATKPRHTSRTNDIAKVIVSARNAQQRKLAFLFTLQFHNFHDARFRAIKQRQTDSFRNPGFSSSYRRTEAVLRGGSLFSKPTVLPDTTFTARA
jgi:hypothetical protein